MVYETLSAVYDARRRDRKERETQKQIYFGVLVLAEIDEKSVLKPGSSSGALHQLAGRSIPETETTQSLAARS